MTDKQTPPEWVLAEAWKRGNWDKRHRPEMLYREFQTFRALCDMIERYEQPPEDRKLLCARKAMAGWMIELEPSGYPKEADIRAACIRAIELWEEGFGK